VVKPCVSLAAAALLVFGASRLPVVVEAQTPSPVTSPVTFNKHVAPILYKNCVECHRPTMFAPMSLVTYEEARPWARAIKQRVARREMPPWSADPHVGKFKNDPRLSQADIDTIVKWVDTGAARGNDRDLPARPVFPEGWTIGTPDAIFTMTEEYSVPAEGTIPYLYFRIPTNLTEDKWVQAIEIRPGDRRVVHHVIANAQPAGANPRTPNKPGVVYEPGVARLLKAGSEIVLQMHYTTMGLPATDRTSLAVIYAKEPPTRVIAGGNAMNVRFEIPPNAAPPITRSAPAACWSRTRS
jgi:hypothetical protein